jgi:hypothetical protein
MSSISSFLNGELTYHKEHEGLHNGTLRLLISLMKVLL